MSTHEPEIVRYHTAGRRQPQLIGKDPSGVPIWGGPYTLYQVAGLVTIPVMWKTRGLWAGQVSGVAVIAVIGMTTAAIIWLLGRIDFSGRNVIYATAALLAAWARTLRPAPRHAHGRGIHVTGLAIHARPRTVRLTPGPPGRTATALRHSKVSVQSDRVPSVPRGASPERPLDRLSPLEAFLAAADKVKVPCP